VVIGPPGSGKSTVGELLADAFGVAFRDTDADVEQAAGRSVADIFIEEGEEAFRARERSAVVAALAEHDGVLALGGGAVLDPATQRDLAAQTVVFLDVSLASAAPRVGLNASRPLLVGNPRARWQALMEARRPVYQRLATVTISTDDATPAEVARRALDALAALGEDEP
jgi:shikimate kinase